MERKYRRIFVLFFLVSGSLLYAHNNLVTPKKKRVSQKAVKETIAEHWEQFFSESVDCVAMIADVQKRLLGKRASIEQFVSNAGGGALQDHAMRLEQLNNRFREFQKNCLQEFEKLEADVERFCIT